MSAAVVTPDRPLPKPTRESQPFWGGLREGKFMIQHCTACGRPRHYPQPFCPHYGRWRAIFARRRSPAASTPGRCAITQPRQGHVEPVVPEKQLLCLLKTLEC
jgi:hypothetical protein